MLIYYEGADHIMTVSADPSIFDRIDISGRPYFLSVGVDRVLIR
jgi:hypothetical protein